MVKTDIPLTTLVNNSSHECYWLTRESYNSRSKSFKMEPVLNFQIDHTNEATPAVLYDKNRRENYLSQKISANNDGRTLDLKLVITQDDEAIIGIPVEFESYEKLYYEIETKRIFYELPDNFFAYRENFFVFELEKEEKEETKIKKGNFEAEIYHDENYVHILNPDEELYLLPGARQESSPSVQRTGSYTDVATLIAKIADKQGFGSFGRLFRDNGLAYNIYKNQSEEDAKLEVETMEHDDLLATIHVKKGQTIYIESQHLIGMTDNFKSGAIMESVDEAIGTGEGFFGYLEMQALGNDGMLILSAPMKQNAWKTLKPGEVMNVPAGTIMAYTKGIESTVQLGVAAWFQGEQEQETAIQVITNTSLSTQHYLSTELFADQVTGDPNSASVEPSFKNVISSFLVQPRNNLIAGGIAGLLATYMFDFSPETGLLMPILSFAGLTTLAREVTTRKLLDHQGQIPLSLINGLVNLVGPAIAIGAEYLINLL